MQFSFVTELTSLVVVKPDSQEKVAQSVSPSLSDLDVADAHVASYQGSLSGVSVSGERSTRRFKKKIQTDNRVGFVGLHSFALLFSKQARSQQHQLLISSFLCRRAAWTDRYSIPRVSTYHFRDVTYSYYSKFNHGLQISGYLDTGRHPYAPVPQLIGPGSNTIRTTTFRPHFLTTTTRLTTTTTRAQGELSFVLYMIMTRERTQLNRSYVGHLLNNL